MMRYYYVSIVYKAYSTTLLVNVTQVERDMTSQNHAYMEIAVWNKWSNHPKINLMSKSSQWFVNCFFSFRWSVAIVAMATVLILMLVNAIREFYTYPKMTSYSVEVKESLGFPAVTICNFSPYNKSKLNVGENPELRSFFLATSPLYGLAENGSWTGDFYKSDMNSKWYKNMSMDRDEMFVMCWFKRVLTPCKDMFVWVMTNAGMCFQFNGRDNTNRDGDGVDAEDDKDVKDGKGGNNGKGGKDGKGRKMKVGQNVTIPGATENLVVLVFVDQDNYMFSQEPAVGIQVRANPR